MGPRLNVQCGPSMKRLTVFFCLALFGAPSAGGGETGAPPVPSTWDDGVLRSGEEGTSFQSASSAPRIRPGMSARAAIDSIGRSPDERLEIGAACGMLEVLTWDEGELRMVTVDGVVSSVSVRSR